MNTSPKHLIINCMNPWLRKNSTFCFHSKLRKQEVMKMSIFNYFSCAYNCYYSLLRFQPWFRKKEALSFGFFSPGNSKYRYVGIWYNSNPVRTVVWVANRREPINDSSGLLSINYTGNLVLLPQNKSVVWSTSSTNQAKKPIVQLLDSANFVLKRWER